MISIRPITQDDAAAFLRLSLTLDDETRFMMLEPGERTTTLAEQRQRIEGWLAAPNSLVFVAAPDDSDGELAGYLAVMGGPYQRNRHNAHIVVGIRQAYSGQGVGTRLFQAMEAWAASVGLHRLELTVMTHNAAAVALYRKLGFQVEGTHAHTLCVEGRYVDEFSMAKLLD